MVNIKIKTEVKMTTIEKVRREKGLTQEAASKKALMPLSSWCKVEKKKVSPTIKTLKKMAKALGVSIHSLIEDDGGG